ncbi:MAG: heme exporter protein CcmB [Limnochordia bacterium]|nr:hypothetical protein [Bacillota bacterium]
MNYSSIWAAAVILRKDIRTELRSRHGVSVLVLFGVTATMVISFALGIPETDEVVAAALLWIILFFLSVAGLGYSFLREEEQMTMDGLLMAASVEGVYLGKALFNLLLLMVAQGAVLPLFILVFNLQIGPWARFLTAMFLGSCGLSAACTLVAALISRTQAKGPLLAVLAFPILFPLLIAASADTAAALLGGAGDSIQVLVLYPGVVGAFALLLVKFIWEE